MSKPTLVLIDFDHTLFDTDRFKDQVDITKPLPKNIDEFLYADSLDFIDYASQYALPAIFSEGPQPFQTEKIKNTQLAKLIKPKYIFSYPPHQKTEAISDFKKNFNILTVIDDRPLHCDHIIKQGIACIRIKRGKYQDNKCQNPPTFEVESLYEIIKKDLLKEMHV